MKENKKSMSKQQKCSHPKIYGRLKIKHCVQREKIVLRVHFPFTQNPFGYMCGGCFKESGGLYFPPHFRLSRKTGNNRIFQMISTSMLCTAHVQG